MTDLLCLRVGPGVVGGTRIDSTIIQDKQGICKWVGMKIEKPAIALCICRVGDCKKEAYVV